MKLVATVAALCVSAMSIHARSVDKPKFLGGPGSQQTTLVQRAQPAAVGTKIATFTAVSIDQQRSLALTSSTPLPVLRDRAIAGKP